MTSISAKYLTDPECSRLVVFVAYPNIVLLDLVGPMQVFSHAPDNQSGKIGYRCVVTSLEGGPINTNTVLSIPSEPMSDYLETKIHTLVVVGGDGANTAMFDEALLGRIKKLAANAQRVCSVCSGALVLAAAGLLDGRRAVTHWDDCKLLKEKYPRVHVELDPIYIKDGSVWTSAGVTAGMDMALAIVIEDLGRASALEVARSMVIHMMRTGGQSQFSPALSRQLQAATGQFDGLHQWISENPALNLKVEALAEWMNMSPRNFSRAYVKQTGTTPAKAVETIRVEVARNLLETSGLGVKQIASDCGFNDEERMRRAFMRHLNVSPSDYRQGFRSD